MTAEVGPSESLKPTTASLRTSADAPAIGTRGSPATVAARTRWTERSSGAMRPERDSPKSGKWNIYKNGTTMVYGGGNKISIAENIAAVLQLQDRDLTRKFSNVKLVPDALLWRRSRHYFRLIYSI